MDRFVVDAGPFIHLDQIGQLEILKKFSTLFVPASVAAEITHESASSNLKTIKNWANIKIQPVYRGCVRRIINIVENSNLQRGEIDCIYLSLQMRPSIFLTDDLRARNTAEKLFIEAHGSVGIIAYSARKKWLSIKKAEESLNALYHTSNLFITYAIIENAIRRLKASD